MVDDVGAVAEDNRAMAAEDHEQDSHIHTQNKDDDIHIVVEHNRIDDNNCSFSRSLDVCAPESAQKAWAVN